MSSFGQFISVFAKGLLQFTCTGLAHETELSVLSKKITWSVKKYSMYSNLKFKFVISTVFFNNNMKKKFLIFSGKYISYLNILSFELAFNNESNHEYF